jgi:hypothetical protein
MNVVTKNRFDQRSSALVYSSTCDGGFLTAEFTEDKHLDTWKVYIPEGLNRLTRFCFVGSGSFCYTEYDSFYLESQQ